jgi:histidyl-tRNA synthetase
MEALQFGAYTIRINNRKLLAGLYGALGLDEAARKAAIIAVDKILKIGKDGVTKELAKIEGISEAAITTILRSTEIQCSISELPSRVADLAISSPLIEEGVQELVTICALMPERAREKIRIDVSLARGLDYYTGLIVETTFDKHPEFGSVISGGRYDDLASEFTDQKLPGVGVSIGLSRLMELAFTERLVSTPKKTPTVALITVYNETERPMLNEVAQELRDSGVSTEVFYKSPKLGKQIEYAEAKGIRYVVFVDAATRQIQVKDLSTKEQMPMASIGDLANSIRTR